MVGIFDFKWLSRRNALLSLEMALEFISNVIMFFAFLRLQFIDDLDGNAQISANF